MSFPLCKSLQQPNQNNSPSQSANAKTRQQNMLASSKKQIQFFDITNIQLKVERQKKVIIGGRVPIKEKEVQPEGGRGEQLNKVSSLKKIKRIQSYNLKQGNQSSCGTVRKVKFQEESEHQSNIDKMEISLNNSQIHTFKLELINKYYRKKVFTQANQVHTKEQQNSFMQFVCGLIRLRPQFKTTKKTSIEKQLLLLWQTNITGQAKEWEMLQNIYQNLTHQAVGQKSQKWPKVGFNSSEPMNELSEQKVLSLLQWYNFSCQQRELAEKILNFCIQIDCPVFTFHVKATQYFCQQLENCQIAAKSWDQFQKWYNNAVKIAYHQLVKISKTNLALVRQQMEVIFKKCGKGIKQKYKQQARKK